MEPNDPTVHRLLGSIEAKVDILLLNSAAHEKRLSSVEHRQWTVAGAVAVFVAIAAPKFREYLGPLFG